MLTGTSGNKVLADLTEMLTPFVEAAFTWISQTFVSQSEDKLYRE